MKLYKLPCVLHEPKVRGEGKYMAEIPALPGCRAWGDTAAEALENLQNVATAFIESYRGRRDPLPKEVKAALKTVSPNKLTEVLIAV